MKEQLTPAEFYHLKWLKAREALELEKRAGTDMETRLLGVVQQVAGVAGKVLDARKTYAGAALDSIAGEIRNVLLETGVTRGAVGSVDDWGVELKDSPEASSFSDHAEEENGPKF
ncbi:hypothetical protein KKA53_05050 [Candidatus Dependentiae bacterium]|nr:hypothetical protein [Candidatus Dependentiae bacterium]